MTVKTPPGSSKPKQPGAEQQVRGRRHRQELGEPLDDPEEGGSEQSHRRRRYDARRRPGFLRRSRRGRRGARPPAPFIGFAPLEHDRDRRGDEHRRIGAADDADEHREGEPFEHVAAEQIQRDDAEQRRARR